MAAIVVNLVSLPESADTPGTLTIIDWLVKDRGRLRAVLRDDWRQAELLPRLLGIATASLALFGVVMAGVVRDTGFDLLGDGLHRASPLAIPLAYPLGLLGALG